MLDNRSQQALQIPPIHFVSRIALLIRTQNGDFLLGSISRQFYGHAHDEKPTLRAESGKLLERRFKSLPDGAYGCETRNCSTGCSYNKREVSA